MGRISKCCRYMIDITGLYPLSLGELGEVQFLGKFDASGHARMMKIGRHVRYLCNFTW